MLFCYQDLKQMYPQQLFATLVILRKKNESINDDFSEVIFVCLCVLEQIIQLTNASQGILYSRTHDFIYMLNVKICNIRS